MSKIIDYISGSMTPCNHKGRWRIRLKVTYKTGEYKYKEFTAKTKVDVKSRAEQFKKAFEDNKNTKVSEESMRNFRESMQDYVERHRFPRLKSTSYDLIIQNLNNQIYPALGEKKVYEVDSDDIQYSFYFLNTNRYS